MAVGKKAAGFLLGYGVTMMVALLAAQLHRRGKDRRRRKVRFFLAAFVFRRCPCGGRSGVRDVAVGVADVVRIDADDGSRCWLQLCCFCCC